MTLVQVYDAQSSLDAAVVADVLIREGIDAQVFGAGLQGGIGELPASGLIRVMVPEAQGRRARDLVRDWEQSQPGADLPPASLSRARRWRSGTLQFASGIFAGIALTLLFVNPARYLAPAEPVSRDRNGDGQADIWWQYDGRGRLIEERQDRNGDGAVDAIIRFDQGAPSDGQQDMDGDGYFEGRWSFQGPLSMLEEDRTQDGIAEYRETYRHNQLVSKAWFDASGILVKRAHYYAGHLTHAELDRDGDGNMDQRIEYNRYAEPLR